MVSRNSKKILTKKEPEKSLVSPLKKKAGRARTGRITVRHRGGGVKRLYRQVEFGQEKLGIPAKVIAIEYDPNRTAFLALLEYRDGVKKYILAPQHLKIGDTVIFDEKTTLNPGNRMRLKNIPVGEMVYNVEIEPGRGGKLIRAAGSAAKVLAHESNYTHLKMPSGEIRKIFQECFASLGVVSHGEHRFEKSSKAGSKRRKGIRPTVRGSAMNPIDHPHGGGEGRTPIGLRFPKTPWGKPALGVKTRKRKQTDKYILQRRKS